MEPKGTRIDDLVRLARQYQLEAEIQETTVEELQRILVAGKLPIAYIDRAVFELPPRQRARHSIRNAIIHNVIPTRVTAKSVQFHDPRLRQIARRSIRLFRQAYVILGGRCVVCSLPVDR
jgi:hypothetical protein